MDYRCCRLLPYINEHVAGSAALRSGFVCGIARRLISAPCMHRFIHSINEHGGHGAGRRAAAVRSSGVIVNEVASLPEAFARCRLFTSSRLMIAGDMRRDDNDFARRRLTRSECVGQRFLNAVGHFSSSRLLRSGIFSSWFWRHLSLILSMALENID